MVPLDPPSKRPHKYARMNAAKLACAMTDGCLGARGIAEECEKLKRFTLAGSFGLKLGGNAGKKMKKLRRSPSRLNAPINTSANPRFTEARAANNRPLRLGARQPPSVPPRSATAKGPRGHP